MSMPSVVAERLLKQLDSSTPFTDRLEFIEYMAALSALYPEEMVRKVTGANKPVKDILWSLRPEASRLIVS